MNETLRDRARGALVGLAVGDAVGTTNEFKERGEFTPLTDMVGGGVFRLNPGEWTDDTSMALCLADSIIEHNDINAADLLSRFSGWYREGKNSHNGRCFDIGTTCSSAIVSFEREGQLEAPGWHWSAGNGSIMRLAPVAIRWHTDMSAAISKAIDQGKTTHGAEACKVGCMALAGILVKLINEPDFDVIPDKHLYEGFKAWSLDNSGFVTATNLAAQWAFVTTDNFRDCILAASNLGGDADTIAAVAGQMAGAKYGMSAIPAEWLEKLAWRDHIIGLADQLFDAAYSD